HDIHIQFGREEFHLLTGLRFRVDYYDVYEEGLIPFRRRVFDSAKDAILQLVLLGFEARHNVPDWILRLANDREDWDMYPWGSYVWPTLYYQLRNANVKRWQPLYATEPEEDDDDHNSYSLMGFTWAFKGCQPIPRLTPDDYEARSDWWVSIDLYRRLEEQDRVLKELLQKDSAQLQVGTMPQAKKGLVIVGQHYGLSDLSGFQNTQGFPLGGPTFPTQASTSFFEGTYATPSYDHHTSSRYPYSHLATPNWQTLMPQPGNVLWSSQYASAHNRDVGLVNPNLMNRERMEARPSMYVQSLYTVLPPTTVLPKRQGDKSRNKGRNANVAPFNLGNAFVDYNEVDDEVLITGVRDTDDYIVYENVNPNKVYMPINTGGDHWVTGAINLPNSRFYMFDYLHSEFIYNDGLNCPVPEQANLKDCGVATCWLMSKLCAGEEPRVYGER
ncbi:phospholipase-like protein, partial [Tanacetum coccineum]